MAQLKFVKSLKTNNINMFDLLVSFVFSKANLDTYRPELTYYATDSIIRLNPKTGKYEVMRCLDTTTGPFDPTKWVKDSVQESSICQFIDTYTISSPQQPEDQPMNRIWFQQIKQKGSIDPESFLS